MTTATQTIDLNDSRINEYLALWHENGRASFRKSYPNLDYDSQWYLKTAKSGRKYIYLDDGTSGALLVDRATGIVYTIKGYGVKNRPIGTLDELIADMRQANEQNRMVRHQR